MSNKTLRTAIVTLMVLALLIAMVVNRLRSHAPQKHSLVPSICCFTHQRA